MTLWWFVKWPQILYWFMLIIKVIFHICGKLGDKHLKKAFCKSFQLSCILSYRNIPQWLFCWKPLVQTQKSLIRWFSLLTMISAVIFSHQVIKHCTAVSRRWEEHLYDWQLTHIYSGYLNDIMWLELHLLTCRTVYKRLWISVG